MLLFAWFVFMFKFSILLMHAEGNWKINYLSEENLSCIALRVGDSVNTAAENCLICSLLLMLSSFE